ncbi:4-hydroxy-3-methylbut-2-enyl diphosphate reductase [Patescibacteria group bacterium]|nr:MAG: 4-hydroxy-3-methylbut-2-enyl diphosphate reductase [Patescibacteria group bacterium]
MKITLSRHAGFCDGVDRAFKIVEKLAKDTKTRRPIFVLGSLVHNSDVVGRVESWGVRKIGLDEVRSAKLGEIGTLVITAHGVGPKIYELLKRRQISYVDTTCPRVIKVQRLAKIFADRGTQIIIVGERDHKEVRGILGWAGKRAKIVETEAALKRLKLDPQKKIAVISQTTQSQDFLKRMAEIIQQKYPQAEIVETICLTTQSRQGEVKKMAQKHEVMVVIGSPESANSTRLWEIAKEINPRTHFVQRAIDLRPSWFKNHQSVGVTAGASTPEWVIEEVTRFLAKVGK